MRLAQPFAKARKTVVLQRAMAHPSCVARDGEGPQHVVRISRTRRRDDAVEDDLACLVDLELRPLDEIGEVGIEERDGAKRRR